MSKIILILIIVADKSTGNDGWRIGECWRKRKLDISWLPDWIRSGEEPCVSWPKVNDFPAIPQDNNDWITAKRKDLK